MFLSVFDMFKIGIGPSSSHTVGPMLAARRFVCALTRMRVEHIAVALYGSLALTGRGHGTDRAVALGLMGCRPDTVDPDEIEGLLNALAQRNRIILPGDGEARFDPQADIAFRTDRILPAHPNAMTFRAFDENATAVREETFYSVGGGFVLNDAELKAFQDPKDLKKVEEVPYAYGTAAQMLAMGSHGGLRIAEMKRANESAMMNAQALDDGLDAVWQAMSASIERGLQNDGGLPGGLGIMRRAKRIKTQLMAEDRNNTKYPHTVMDWISVYAIAVNEENAAGGRIVTAPTNGAAGIIPAVIRYYLDFCPGADRPGIHEFLLVAASIGGLIKYNASISGAEVGCQGEVGSASAMAAAGLCAALGGSNEQVENAAEIALEHHLGMTCDPVGGLVQVPCIERNAMGAVKAINAASLALKGNGSHFVPLDSAIATMKATGEDMLNKYKETSQGGLAVNVTEC